MSASSGGGDAVFLAVGEPVDLDNCAREPIHIPGSVQPRGVLLVVREPEFTILQASANLDELVGIPVESALGAALSDVIGVGAHSLVERAVSTFGDLRERNPLEVEIAVRGKQVAFDVILHREGGGILLVELELANGPRPFSFPNSYLAVRGAVGELNRAVTLPQLFDTAARAVRDLTGFDRVMVYRYDHEYNGEVVAEAKREDLNSFMGLHYPASDIPAQARALYEKNWIRLISDIEYVPAPLVPVDNPATGQPTDLTHSTLRSVSPIHVEYLRNMGVHASMSISLLRDGKLWGLIACHHYAGTHLPPYGVRAAAEFLGSTLSLRLVDRFEDDDLRQRLASQGVLAKITAATRDEDQTLVDALLGAPDLRDLVPSDGVAVLAEGRLVTRGTVPDDDTIRALAAWAQATDEQVVATDSLSVELTGVETDPSVASGVLAMLLPDAQYALWFRAEVQRSVDWGGDPYNKAIAVQEGDGVRLSPRKSFERWRELVREKSLPWTRHEQDLAEELRRRVVEALYARSQREVRLAETFQRSLLPDLPQLGEWSLSAHYEPAAGGRIGGDWYDAIVLRGNRLVVVLGDVAGHGIASAGTMAQLRNVLRAYLFDGDSPADALARLNRFAAQLLPRTFATLVVVSIDVDSGAVVSASAGHPTPLRLVGGEAEPAPIVTSPPLGVRDAVYRTSEFTLDAGTGLVLFSDGLIERRDEDLDISLTRLRNLVPRLGAQPTADDVFGAAHPEGADDATVVAVHRPA